MVLKYLCRALVGVVVLSFALAASSSAHAERRIALVVGNSHYRNVAELPNPANDARLMARTLAGLGFTLVGDGAQLDLDKLQFDAIVQEFGKQAQGADVALFYYAGHGVQLRGNNYLVPITANPAREADVDFQMLDTNLVLRQMEAAGSRLNLLLLDACRNNPFGSRGFRSTATGLAQMQAPAGTLISFATQPGNVALDGSGANSPYTKALVETIQKPGLGLFDAFNAVGLIVKRETGDAQQPWVSSSPIAGTFHFAGQSASLAPAQPGQPVLTPVAPSAAVDAAFSDWLTADGYQRLFDQNLRRNYYPRIVEARAFPDGLRYRGLFVPFLSGAFAFGSRHGISPAEFADRDRNYQREGYTLVHRQSVRFGNREYVQGTWTRP